MDDGTNCQTIQTNKYIYVFIVIVPFAVINQSSALLVKTIMMVKNDNHKLSIILTMQLCSCMHVRRRPSNNSIKKFAVCDICLV